MNTTLTLHLTLIEQSEPDECGVVTYSFSALPETCCIHRNREPHECPFQSDVHNNSSFLCTCCTDCVQECVDNI